MKHDLYMSTAVAAKPRAFFATDQTASVTFTGHQFEQNKDGSALVKQVEVFKAGTFRDSWGDQHTWLPEHLTQMVQNFNTLIANDILPNVPARRDHSVSVDKIMGYIQAMNTDGVKLFVDIHVTEPSDVDKLVRGTYRARSLEVGMYIDNNEAAYWPVVFGVAYVDMPAVEGLHNKSKEISYFSQIPQGEGNMGTQNGTQTDDRPPQTVIHVHGSGTGDTPTPPTPTPPTPAPQPAPAPSPAPNPTPVPTVNAFRVNGADTVDFAAVQRHIDTLELVVKTTDEDSRKAFVSALAKDNKIVAAQTEPMQQYALTLSADGYKAWQATFAGAQAIPLLQPHGANGSPNAGADADPGDDQIEVLRETVATLHRIWPKEKVEKTAAFQQLTALTANKS